MQAVYVSPSSYTLYIDSELPTMYAYVAPTHAADTSVSWVSDHPEILSVNAQTGELSWGTISNSEVIVSAISNSNSEAVGTCVFTIRNARNFACSAAGTINSMKNVWIPNRNGLFINIAAAFSDSFEYDYIVIGANKEEAATFSDNSQKFIDDMNEVLKTSTNYDIKVTAPLIEFDKNEIVKKAIELKVPLKYINSCYNSQKGHCGHCESCSRLKRALKNNGCDKILKELFSD